LADFVRQNDLGSIVNYGDVEGLKNEIVRILGNPADVESRADYGREYVLKHFGWDRIADNWLKVYQECASKVEVV
jgi:glycosyltransferase involved in cell wall biosynthesis